MFWLTIILFIVFLSILIPCIVKLYRQKETVRAKATVSTCVFYSLLFISIFLFQLKVPYWTILLTMVASFVSGFYGQYLQMYFRSIVFDRYLHGYGAFSFSMLFFYLLDHFLEMVAHRCFLRCLSFCWAIHWVSSLNY